ncbi:hypothetical protein L1D11_04570 [Vibrio sp. Isolate32]|uniref:hypothetical protein n=1 Tax=Vibrio sp. Isolate32 TaxID=2908538 RepID=UPI001EFDF8D8|nr:hypothetical protein [Vibrio sp. Isolate32]MCG9552675.1 hypothetical protein [Vibrio sp. Isolate32]
MNSINPQTTYQYMVDLRDQELAKARTLEEKVKVLIHFCTVQDALYERDWQSLNTAA